MSNDPVPTPYSSKPSQKEKEPSEWERQELRQQWARESTDQYSRAEVHKLLLQGAFVALIAVVLLGTATGMGQRWERVRKLDAAVEARRIAVEERTIALKEKETAWTIASFEGKLERLSPR